jgi:flagellar basal-body rod protein FlgB
MRQPNIIQLLEAGARARHIRQGVITNNVANLHTPGFRRSDVKFEEFLADALDDGGKLDNDEIKPEIYRPYQTPVKSDGNDVDMEQEVGELMKNAGRFKLYMKLMAKQYGMMSQAIRGE